LPGVAPIAPDLRGYSDCGKPSGGTDRINDAKRAMAQEIVEVMASLGFDRFAVISHQRGAASRIACRFPEENTSS
jgi:haloacetate dehalogenase